MSHNVSHSPSRWAASILLLVVTTLLVSGCGSSDDEGSAAPSPSPSSSGSASSSSSPEASPTESQGQSAAASVITIKDFKFSDPGTVAPGATVMVTNEDSEAHTVTADGKGGFDVNIAPGATAKLTAPDSAGSFPYHCTFHSDMHGTLKVG